MDMMVTLFVQPLLLMVVHSGQEVLELVVVQDMLHLVLLLLSKFQQLQQITGEQQFTIHSFTQVLNLGTLVFQQLVLVFQQPQEIHTQF
jgi:hypothetical protein